MTQRHLKIVAGTDHDACADNPPVAPTLPGATGEVFDEQTELAVSMMNHALDAVETAMFGGPLRGHS